MSYMNVRRHASQCAATDPTIWMHEEQKCEEKSTAIVWNRFCITGHCNTYKFIVETM